MFILCSIILIIWIWLLRYLYRTYNEFYILLERIYSGEYFREGECDENDRSASPISRNDENNVDGDEAECIELETFERTENED